MNRPALAAMLLGLVAACRPAQVPPPAPAPTLRAESAGWESVTAGRYAVVPQALMNLCRNPPPDQLAVILADHAAEHGPHRGHAIVVRVNPLGVGAFRAREPVPVGTVVVKEKYDLDASESADPVALATMTKREPGYDPAHGDWVYAFEESPPGESPRVSRGRIDSCIDCHHAAGDRDYLYRPYLAGGTPAELRQLPNSPK